MNSLLDAALSYAARGWAVFPLKPGQKTPATPNGFKDASLDAATITQWWEQMPRANIGIATGASSGLVVLDIDLDEAKRVNGYESFAELAPEGSEQLTLGAVTPRGGTHLYYAHPGHNVQNKAGFLHGLDIRGDGGYILAPPSVVNGVEYEWTQELLAPSALPPWLAGYCAPPAARSATPRSPASLEEGEKGDLAKATLKFIVFGAPAGQWHALMFKACMDLKQQGYSFDEAWEKLESSGHTLDSEHDVPLLEDVYANREPKHPPRLAEASAQPEMDIILSKTAQNGYDNVQVAEAEALNVPASTLVGAMFKALADPEKMKGTSTGLPGLDALLGGGKRTGELSVTMALAKTGKSSLYAHLIHSLLSRGIGVGYASREMRPDSEVLPNLLSIEHGESVLDLSIKGRLTSQHEAKYRDSVARWPLHFAGGYGPFPLEDFKRWTGELREQGVRWFFIDHLHYCLAEEEDWGKAVTLVRALKTLTIEHDIHIDLIVQPTKLQEGMKLSLNSLKGGSGIGQALDNLLFLEPTGTANVRELTLDRARFPLAEPGRMFIQYDKPTRRFIEVELQPEEPAPPSPGAPRPGENRFNQYRIDA